MKPEQKVVSLELANALKAAGYPQMESERMYDDQGIIIPNLLYEGYRGPAVASPDSDELLERLPGYFNGEIPLHLAVVGDRWTATYLTVTKPPHRDENPAEALGKLLKWCLDEGHVTP